MPWSHSMTTTHPSPLVEGPYATHDLPTTSILWAAANGDLQDLTNRLVDGATAYGMETSTEKSKIMTNNMNNINADISMNGRRLEEVTSLRYPGATLCKDDICSAEICVRIASALAALARLNSIWRCNTSNFTSKLNL